LCIRIERWVVAPRCLVAVSTSETSENFYRTTLRDNPEDSHLHTRRRENLKFHGLKVPCSAVDGSKIAVFKSPQQMVLLIENSCECFAVFTAKLKIL
jgi:hypothetical protein